MLKKSLKTFLKPVFFGLDLKTRPTKGLYIFSRERVHCSLTLHLKNRCLVWESLEHILYSMQEVKKENCLDSITARKKWNEEEETFYT